jgi:tetratricopeptide (TPR) repeat protein
MFYKNALVLSLFLSMSSIFLHAEDVEDLIKKGDALDAKQQTQDALEVFLAADKVSPHNAEVLRRIAQEYSLAVNDVSGRDAKIEKGQKALDYSKQAVAADPNNAMAQLAVAISYGRLAELLDSKTKIEYSKKVAEYAKRSLELDPKNDLTYYVLGAWNYGLANLNPFVRVIAKTVYGELPPASNQQAIEYLQKAIELNPDRVVSRVDLGRAYLAAGEKEKGQAELKKALAMPNREKDDAAAKAKAQAALR